MRGVISGLNREIGLIGLRCVADGGACEAVADLESKELMGMCWSWPSASCIEGRDCSLGNGADSFSSSVARRDSGGDI